MIFSHAKQTGHIDVAIPAWFINQQRRKKVTHWFQTMYDETQAITPIVRPIPCRFGCEDSLGLFYFPAGCVCYGDPIQALCLDHAIKCEPLEGVFMLAKWAPCGQNTSL